MRAFKSPSIMLRIAVVLLCLVLFSAHLASGMFARYTVSAGDIYSARVAESGVHILPGEGFEPDDTGNIPVSVTPSGVATYRFKVQNDSEFAVKYDIAIYLNDCYNSDGELIREADGTFTNLKLDGSSQDSLVDGIYTFNEKGELEPGETSDEFTITMQLKYTTTSPGTASGVIINYNYRMPFVILAKATQLD